MRALSSIEQLPLASFMDASMKSCHVAMSLEIWVVSYIQPVLPQSLQTEYSFDGSHSLPRYNGSTLTMFGSSDLSNFSSRPFWIICGMNGPVGTTMSKPLESPAVDSLVMRSSLLA